MGIEVFPYQGIILNNDGTKQLFNGREYEEHPGNCSFCGKRLTRGEMSRAMAEKAGFPKAIFTYYCSSPECSRLRRAAHEKMVDRTEIINERLLKAGVPQGYLYFSFASYESKVESGKLVKIIMQFMKSGCPGLLFYGSRGTGKSHACVATLRCLLESGLSSVFYKNLPELIAEARSDQRDDDGRTERALYDQYAMHYLLVLDDLGPEKTSEFSVAVIYNLIDRRIREGKKTIISTNLIPDDIREKLDERIHSRLLEFQRIAFAGRDHRDKRKVNA